MTKIAHWKLLVLKRPKKSVILVFVFVSFIIANRWLHHDNNEATETPKQKEIEGYDCRQHELLTMKRLRRHQLYISVFHYFLWRPLQWANQLKQLKQEGFNAVEIYIPWNLHESGKGRYTFSKNLNLPVFLEIARRQRMFVFLRPGPYICSTESESILSWPFPNFYLNNAIQVEDVKEALSNFYQVLANTVKRQQLSPENHGRKLVVIKLENQYGSINDKNSLSWLIMKVLSCNGLGHVIYVLDDHENSTEYALFRYRRRNNESELFCNAIPASLLKPENTTYLVESRRHNKVDLLFYNRVPKCGSTSMLDIVINRSSISNEFMFKSSIDISELFPHGKRDFMKLWREPTKRLVEMHSPFINFKGLGKPFAYINIVRDPVERLISQYYFLRKDKPWKPEIPEEWKGVSLKDAVQNKLVNPFSYMHPGGLSNGSIGQVTFFCGIHPLCFRHDNKEALQKAKMNIENHYLVVGLLEHMEETLNVLEHHVPDFFKGVTVLNKNDMELNKNKQKQPVRTKLRNKMRGMLKMEYELYYFIRRRLFSQYNSIPGISSKF